MKRSSAPVVMQFLHQLVLAMVLVASTAVWGAEETVEEELRRKFERGPVQVLQVVRPARPVIGDIIELELEVVAEPDVEVLMPEFGEALGRFEIIDFAPSDRLDDQGRTVSRQKYRLQPSRSGSQSIPPLRVEFVDRRPGQASAPEGEDAYEILTDRLSLVVAPLLADDAPLVLKPAHSDLAPRREGGPAWWVWALAIAGALAIASPVILRAYRSALAGRRKRSAYEVARTEMDALLAVRLSLIVRSYLEDRFGLRSPELTTQEFLSEMGRSPDLARTHQKMLRAFLEQADLVKFAGLRPEASAVAEAIGSAERFLEETRDQVGTKGSDLSLTREEGQHA